MTTPSDFQHVSYLWDDETAATLGPVERLVYRSNLLGQDQRVTNTGGGNTSSKRIETDPLSGQPVEVLWVKGSGGDLRTAKQENFSSLYMDKIRQLRGIYAAADEHGVKTPIEDDMVGKYLHCVYNLNPRASSIDTPLHAFIPASIVDHTHPNAVIAIAAAKDGKSLAAQIFGPEVGWVDWQRPGFDLGLVMGDMAMANPALKGLVMGGHGLINWAEDDKTCYELSLDIIEKAARYIESRDKGDRTFGGQKYSALPADEREDLLLDLLPKLRGLISQQNKFIATVQADETILRFVNSHDAARLAELGTSCPDHFLRTKIKPLYVEWDPQTQDLDALLAKLESGLAHYRQDYTAYYTAHKHPTSPAMRDPNPTVILIPGVGMIAWGKNKSESRVTAEFYNCAVEVMRGAEAVSDYVALPKQEAFDIEYWLLEEAKLRRMPPEQELARNVVVVIGAGSGIGKAIALRVAQAGAHVVAADLNEDAAQATAAELTDLYGVGIGVAGTGISACGAAIGLRVDMTDRASVQALLRQTVLAYGGVDNLVITAGVFIPPDASGHITDDKWDVTFDVNVKGVYLVADEARNILEAQGLSASVLIATSVNGTVAKKGSLAYDTSKAAANHLVRELAIELAPTVRVNGLAPATVIAGSAMFSRARVISGLLKYDIAFNESEETEVLRERLAAFYAQRTLLKQAILTQDQAEAAYLLLSSAFAKTTGQIINVDGGLVEAFLR